jgi:hypothetical protein
MAPVKKAQLWVASSPLERRIAAAASFRFSQENESPLAEGLSDPIMDL